jgi:DNA replication and repair protein RecF
MPIASVQIKHFRILEAVNLSPCLNGLNIIYGDNGSGKTSLLEAIYYLSHGRSFRNAMATRLIQHHAEKFTISAQVVNALKREFTLGVERGLSGKTRLRLAEQDVASISEFAYFLPIRVINSQSHHLFELGPVFRRKYLDWGLFYYSEQFLSCWRQFERVLKQRNVLLRHNRPKNELSPWTEELIKYGCQFDQLRREYIQALSPFLQQIAENLLDIPNICLEYQAGWDMSIDYPQALSQVLGEEYHLGFTQVGPHRADFDIKIASASAKHFLSRGQQKLLICAMILAQGMLLAQQENRGLIYLIDDLPSELDKQGKQRLISLLAQQQCQIFITAIERDAICNLAGDQLGERKKVFHVEHGFISGHQA